MNGEFKHSYDHWRASSGTVIEKELNPEKLEGSIVPFFKTGILALIVVQVTMILIMCLFIFIGASLHVVKLKKINVEEYKSHFNLSTNIYDTLLEELNMIEKSIGEISFFKVLKSSMDLSNPIDYINEGIVVCGGTHRRGTYWSEESVLMIKKIIKTVLGDKVLIEFKRGLVFAISNLKIDNSKRNSYYKGAHTQPSNSYVLFNLFLASSGYVSPCYMFGKRLYSYILGRHSGLLGYLMVTLPWFFSVLSPQPVMLVHLPRFILYTLIAMYRVVFLHMVINFAEKKFFAFDFSDHIVLYAMYVLIISIEWCAVGNNIKNRLIVSCIRGYCLSLLGAISYSSFFTALYFHSPLETFFGFTIAFVGLFGLFWALIFMEYINLSKIGL
ncbi:inositol phospholipid synthesis protein Scs3p [Cryptosporidium felis]|nr:inositol phospholipid synthesis protein Scs3p [Cryptosporidium felis]